MRKHTMLLALVDIAWIDKNDVAVLLRREKHRGINDKLVFLTSRGIVKCLCAVPTSTWIKNGTAVGAFGRLLKRIQ